MFCKSAFHQRLLTGLFYIVAYGVGVHSPLKYVNYDFLSTSADNYLQTTRVELADLFEEQGKAQHIVIYCYLCEPFF